jgi:hypothetical protein
MGTTMIETDGSPFSPIRDRRGVTEPRQWAVAALVGVLAVAALSIGEGAGMGLTAERGLIEDYLGAWYGGDYDTAAGLTAPQRLRTGPSEQRARDEVDYQVILGADVGVGGCEALPPQTVRCEISYANALNRAVGAPPASLDQQFGVESGKVAFVAGPYLEDPAMTESFEAFARLLFPADYEEACVPEPNYQSPGCAAFKLEHLEDWASWHRIEHG